jgi:hypothetical protein
MADINDETSPNSLTRLSFYSEDGEMHPIPKWAEWLINLGEHLSGFQSKEKIWLCISVPERRYASSFLALGAIRQALRTAVPESLENRFEDLPLNSSISWVDSNGHLRSGKFLGIEDGMLVYRSRGRLAYEGAARRPMANCGSFWPLGEDEDAFAGSRLLADNPYFISECLGASILDCCSKSSDDVMICGVKSEITEDLNENCFSLDGTRGKLLDLVRPYGYLPQGQRCRSTLLAASSNFEYTERSIYEGLVIFDGPQSYLRLREVVEAPVNIVVLGRWEPRSEDAAISAMLEKTYKSNDFQLPLIEGRPSIIETYSWAEDFV